jgi:hypothetical protein
MLQLVAMVAATAGETSSPSFVEGNTDGYNNIKVAAVPHMLEKSSRKKCKMAIKS